MKIDIRELNDIFIEDIAQIELFAHFLNIDVNTIIDCIQTKKCIKSPLRIDDNPSFSFYIKNGKIKARDFAGHFWGDIYDLVGLLNVILVNHNTLPMIKSIIKSANVATINHQIQEHKKYIYPIVFTARKWEIQDKMYWGKLQLPLDYLIQMDVFPVQTAVYYNKPIYNYSISDPCYAYHLGYKNNIPITELYFPKRKKNARYPKFITNYGSLKGINKLTSCDNLIITKSNKDRLAIKYQLLLRNLDKEIECIAVASESTNITKTQNNQLRKTYKNIVTLFDNDSTGFKASRYHRDNYNYTPTVIHHLSIRGLVKDFTELLGNTNPKVHTQLINNYLKYHFNV